ncbi:MAG: TetR/AcrR family transcriptional regulator [Deltaproteobacteria bacterium]|nr:TetR/AcrR family transcriptional regulator [Deltaproteobacteria bacterium]
MATRKKGKAKPVRRPGRPTAAAAIPPDAEIMARGLSAFAERGFDGTSVRDLAQILGVSHNFIHDRYGSKDGFWRAVVDDSLRSVEEGIDAILAAPAADELERLRAVVRHIAGYTGPRPQLHLMLTFEGARNSPRLMYIFERYLQPFTLKLTPVITALVHDGVLRPVPWHVLFFLIGAPGTALGNRTLAGLLGRPRGNDDATAAMFADLIVNALRVHPAGG